MADKRRLPVLGGSGAQTEPGRAPWQWVGFGAVMIVAAWLCLGTLAWWMASALQLGMGTTAVAMVPSVILAGLGGGFLVGRYGAPAGVREATLAGACVGALAFALSCAGAREAAWPTLLVAPAVLVASASGGGAWGVRRRAP